MVSQGGAGKGCWMMLPADETMLLWKAHLALGTCSNSYSMSICPVKEPDHTVFTGAGSPNSC